MFFFLLSVCIYHILFHNKTPSFPRVDASGSSIKCITQLFFFFLTITDLIYGSLWAVQAGTHQQLCDWVWRATMTFLSTLPTEPCWPNSQMLLLQYWLARKNMSDLRKTGEAHLCLGVLYSRMWKESCVLLCGSWLCFSVRPAGGARVSLQLRSCCGCWPSHVAPCEAPAGAHSSGGRKETCSVLSCLGQQWLFCDDEWVRLSNSPVLFMFGHSLLSSLLSLPLGPNTHHSWENNTLFWCIQRLITVMFLCECANLWTNELFLNNMPTYKAAHCRER